MSDTTKPIADLAEEGDKDNTIALSTGVVLTAKQIPPAVYIKVIARDKRPPVHEIWVERQQRWSANPDHPDYIKATQDWEYRQMEALLNAMVMFGTELKSVPKGFGGVNSKGWIEELQAIGEPVFPENQSWRYLNWVLTKACVDESDFALIQQEVGRLSGVPEQDVSEAGTFPGRN